MLTDGVQILEVSRLKVCALRVSSCALCGILKVGRRSSPLTGWPWSLPRAEHHSPVWSLKGPGNPTQLHQTLCLLQGPEVRACQRPKGQPWLQKLTLDPTVINKKAFRIETNKQTMNMLHIYQNGQISDTENVKADETLNYEDSVSWLGNKNGTEISYRTKHIAHLTIQQSYTGCLPI